MKKIFLFAALITFTGSSVIAQLTLQPTVPAVGMLQKNQLWNVLVINGSGQPFDCRLDIVVRDRATGDQVFTATSSQFSIVKGAKQLNVNLLNPIQYNYSNPGISSNLQGLIPAGSYTVCYTLNRVPSEDFSLANECISFDAEPLSPPMLMYPADSSELDISPTQFNWTPPTPAGMFNMLQYEVMITEILPGQKAAEALQDNIPFFTNGNQLSNFLNYPASSQAFEKEKWYAWQVVAKDNRSYAAKSETWVFKIIEKKNAPTFNSESYIEVKESRNNRDGIYVVKGDDLKFRYYSFDKDKETNIKILSAEGKTLYEQKEIIRSGNNYISLKLNSSFQKEKVYKVTFADQQGNIYNASFSLQ